MGGGGGAGDGGLVSYLNPMDIKFFLCDCSLFYS